MNARWPVVISTGLVALLTPAVAAANFFWPPALYYYSFTQWWVVVAGLGVEAAVAVFSLKLSVRKAIGVSVVTNAISAVLGFLATWPVVFYEGGIDLAVRTLGGISIVAIVAVVVALNIAVEYWVAVRLCCLPRSRRVIGNVVVANLLSFMLIVVSIPTWFTLS